MNIYPIASGSQGNAILLSHNGYNLLLDAGINIMRLRKALINLNIRLTKLDGVLVSHSHGDHCKTVKELCQFGIDCYMSNDTAQALNIDHHRIKIIDPQIRFTISNWVIYTFHLIHDIENFGFLIAIDDKCIFYAVDTAYIPIKLPAPNRLTHILIECNYDLNTLRENVNNGKINESAKYRIMKNHMNLETAKKFFKANDLSQIEEIWLLHMSKNNIDANYAKEEIQKLTGKIVKLKN